MTDVDVTLCENNGKETITSYIRELKLTSDESDVSNVNDVRRNLRQTFATSS